MDSSPLSQRAAIAKVCAIALHHKTKTNTNTNPDPNRHRRRCSTDPNARIQKFIPVHYMAIAAICDSGLSPDNFVSAALLCL